MTADQEKPRGEPVTVAECRQAIRFHEWELLRLTGELSELRDRTAAGRDGPRRFGDSGPPRGAVERH